MGWGFKDNNYFDLCLVLGVSMAGYGDGQSMGPTDRSGLTFSAEFHNSRSEVKAVIVTVVVVVVLKGEQRINSINK